MHSGNKAMKLVSTIVLLLLLVYLAFLAADYFLDPLSTTLCYRQEVQEHLELNGYLLRQEEILNSSDGILSLSRGEGERVGVGQEIAVVYESESAQESEAQLQALQLQLQQLQYAQDVSASADIALKLDSTIISSIYQLHSCLVGGDLSSLSSSALDLKALILKRDYNQSGVDTAQQIKEVSSEITSLQKSLRSASHTITADRSGIYSAVIDGYETVLTPSLLDSLLPSQLNALQPDSSLTSNVGKLIYGNQWYYVFCINTADASHFPVKSTVTLRFTKNAQRSYTMTVQRVSDEENGQRAVVLSCNKYLTELTLLRNPSAQLVISSYSGLRVPASALRMDENGQLGVYCRIGKNARFKPVSQVYTGEGFYLVEPAPDTAEALILRSGDEIIVSGGKLFDGKVID